MFSHSDSYHGHIGDVVLILDSSGSVSIHIVLHIPQRAGHSSCDMDAPTDDL